MRRIQLNKMVELKVKTGLNEIQTFLKEKNIQFNLKIQESFDAGIIIEIVGISIGIANILIELKKWLSNKDKKPVVVFINNTQININTDSEEQIKEKIG